MWKEQQLASFTPSIILVMLTGLTFFADLQFEFGFATTWLPYFLLAVPVSAPSSGRAFLGAVGGFDFADRS